MKVVLCEHAGAASYGVLGSAGIVSIDDVLEGDTAQERLSDLIERFEALRPSLESRTAAPGAIPLDSVRLLSPIPRPGKILCTTAVYAPGAATAAPQLLATLKSPESVIGPSETVQLPDVDSGWQFVPQAALGLVMKGAAKDVRAADWRTAVFGYTCAIDVMARGDQQFGRDFWLAKADTLGPLGPCLVTLDELPDPAELRVRSWQNGTPAQDFRIAEASHSIPAQVEFATTVMTLHSGDVLACGTSPQGPRPLAGGDRIEVEIDNIGRLAVSVAAPVGSGV